MREDINVLGLSAQDVNVKKCTQGGLCRSNYKSNYNRSPKKS
nr:MAG TPA: hypothetical protein [Caudoviricetes sp.]